LAGADEEVTDLELTEILQRLVDVDQLVQVRRSDSGPVSYAVSSGWEFDVVDLLESEICRVLRERDEIGLRMRLSYGPGW
jgi:hypothetical protein